MSEANLLYVDVNAFHDVAVKGRRVLLHVPSTGIFDLDEVTGEILDFVRPHSRVSFDDLQARFGLDAAMLDELRRNHVLYDRNADGEFLHCYTQPFEDRFFFEFIERRGGYTQYGAANAPVRLAALAQQREQGH